jgi:DNA-binding transcriptional regulator YdaS (Cro superfamily)
MTKQEIEALVKAKRENPGAGRIVLAKKAGVSENKVRAWLKGGVHITPTKAPAAEPSTIKKGIAVTAFLHKLDYPAQLRSAIRQHCSSAFIPESDFRALSRLNPNAFRQAVNTGEFVVNQFKIDGVVYWSSEANIKKAKVMRGIE